MNVLNPAADSFHGMWTTFDGTDGWVPTRQYDATAAHVMERRFDRYDTHRRNRRHGARDAARWQAQP